MAIPGILFLYCFLPAVLAVYLLVPKKLKNTVLLLSGIVFYFVGVQETVLVVLVSAAINYALSKLSGRYRESCQIKARLCFAIVLNLGVLCYFAYYDFFVMNINELTGLSLPLLKASVPLGIGVLTLQLIGYHIDTVKGKIKPERNFIDFTAYIMMFPQISAGLIVGYREISSELKKRKCTFDLFGQGVKRLCIGTAKKVILADSLAMLISEISYSGEITVLGAWITALAFMLQIYSELSGLADIAVGVGLMLGFHLPENFNYPFVAKSISEFFHRWHITLSTWLREYIYNPLCGKKKNIGAIFGIISFGLIYALWYGAAWNYVLWGGLCAIMLLGEKFVWGKLLKKIPTVFKHIYVIFFVLFGFVLFSAKDIPSALNSFGNMFGFGNVPASGIMTFYYLKSYAAVLIISILAATPLFSTLRKKVKPVIADTLEPFVCAALLIVSTAYLIGSTTSAPILIGF